jgi:hypothetical protein
MRNAAQKSRSAADAFKGKGAPAMAEAPLLSVEAREVAYLFIA